MELFKKTYDGESIVDIGRDVHEAFDSDFNSAAALIPQDEHGFQQGEFVVTIEWVPNVQGKGRRFSGVPAERSGATLTAGLEGLTFHPPSEPRPH